MTPDVGTELANPTAGTRMRFTATATSTAGEYVEVEAVYPAHSAAPPAHLHPLQEEHFTVFAGRVTVRHGGEEFVAAAGDEFIVTRGTVHQMWNDGDEPATVLWRTTPALGTGELFCELWQVARDNAWSPTPLQLLDVLGRHSAEFVLASGDALSRR